MSVPGRIDPILAFLDFAEEYRRSWRCWLIGGPAAVDALEIEGAGTTTGLCLIAGFETEESEVVRRTLPAFATAALRWHDEPEPTPPPDGVFRDDEQSFPLEGSLAVRNCPRCHGTGTGAVHCPDCGGRGHDPQGTPCPTCGGEREWVCKCAQDVESVTMLAFAEARYRYRQDAHVWHQLPVGEARRGLARLFRRSLDEGSHVAFEARTTAGLCDALRAAGIADEDALEEIAYKLDKARRDPALRARGRILFQRFQARITHGATVSVRLGTLRKPLWAIGTGERFRRSFPGAFWHPGRAFGALALGLWEAIQVPKGIITLYRQSMTGSLDLDGAEAGLGIISGSLLLWLFSRDPFRSELRDLRRAAGVLLRSLACSLRRRPEPMVVVAGPDPAASGRLFSLFAHLASAAQMADPAQGGTVIDSAWEHLPAMLRAGGSAPDRSATYRIRFGEGVPGPRQARMLHVCIPDGKPDELSKRVLGRASGVWLVLPARATRQADTYARQILLRTGDAPVTVVFDGAPAPDPLAGYPGARGALTHRPHRCVSLDLSALSDRYLQGTVPPAEAAALVRGLAGETAPADPELPALPRARQAPVRSGGIHDADLSRMPDSPRRNAGECHAPPPRR